MPRELQVRLRTIPAHGWRVKLIRHIGFLSRCGDVCFDWEGNQVHLPAATLPSRTLESALTVALVATLPVKTTKLDKIKKQSVG